MVATSTTTIASIRRMPKPLQRQQQQHVEGGDDDRPEQRNVEEQVDGHGAAQHLGQIAGRRSPSRTAASWASASSRVPVAAACARSLPVTTPSRAEITCMKMAIRLASADHPQQPVLELRPALQVGSPVARVHVADADQKRRADKCAVLLPEAGLVRWQLDGAMHPLKRYLVFMRSIGRRGYAGPRGLGRPTNAVLLIAVAHLPVPVPGAKRLLWPWQSSSRASGCSLTSGNHCAPVPHRVPWPNLAAPEMIEQVVDHHPGDGDIEPEPIGQRSNLHVLGILALEAAAQAQQDQRHDDNGEQGVAGRAG